MNGELRNPNEPIAKKKERLFSNDFERAKLAKDQGWAFEVPNARISRMHLNDLPITL